MFFFYVVHGLHIIEHIKRLWRKLRNIDLGHHEPWLSMRDYKVIHRFEVKMVGSKTYEAKTKDFDSFLIDTRNSVGKLYGVTYSRFDWALVKARWLLFIQPLEEQIIDP